jgi:16S rRNA (cytidine1402-2'-O)-methyltransferase
LSVILGERQISVARELTKLHEQVIRTTARNATTAGVSPRGEFTIVIGPAERLRTDTSELDNAALTAYFYQLTNQTALSRRQAAAMTGKKFGLSPNEVYDRLERLKGAGPSS